MSSLYSSKFSEVHLCHPRVPQTLPVSPVYGTLLCRHCTPRVLKSLCVLLCVSPVSTFFPQVLPVCPPEFYRVPQSPPVSLLYTSESPSLFPVFLNVSWSLPVSSMYPPGSLRVVFYHPYNLQSPPVLILYYSCITYRNFLCVTPASHRVSLSIPFCHPVTPCISLNLLSVPCCLPLSSYVTPVPTRVFLYHSCILQSPSVFHKVLLCVSLCVSCFSLITDTDQTCDLFSEARFGKNNNGGPPLM